MRPMKSTLVGFAAGSLLLAASISPVFADENTPVASPTPSPRSLIQEQFRNTVKTIRQTMRSERNKIHAATLQKNFGLYALRLNNIASRIQSAIDKRKAAGKDTTAAQTQLDTAKTTLTQAIADGQKAVDMFNAITVDKWDIQKPEIKAAIAQAQLARKEFVTARTQMVQAVKLLRQVK